MADSIVDGLVHEAGEDDEPFSYKKRLDVPHVLTLLYDVEKASFSVCFS